MRFPRTGYGLKGQGGTSPAWVDGWVRSEGKWHFQVIRHERCSWITDLLPAERMLKMRIFEPHTPDMKVLGHDNRPFEIHNLAMLAPLLEPRELLGRMLPHVPLSARHAIYVAETEAGRLYVPALLLIERLWLWSRAALEAILTPNSLDVFIGAASQIDGRASVAADPQLASRTPTEVALRRIAWLASSAKARASWSSVLTHAYEGRIDLALPTARLAGWTWGVELPTGFMACEINSMELQFESAKPEPRIRIGSKVHHVPAVPLRDNT